MDHYRSITCMHFFCHLCYLILDIHRVRRTIRCVQIIDSLGCVWCWFAHRNGTSPTFAFLVHFPRFARISCESVFVDYRFGEELMGSSMTARLWKANFHFIESKIQHLNEDRTHHLFKNALATWLMCFTIIWVKVNVAQWFHVTKCTGARMDHINEFGIAFIERCFWTSRSFKPWPSWV